MKYQLYDLRVTTVGDPATFNCSHKAGEGFSVYGENLQLNKGTERFSQYALATVLQFIPAKQRVGDANDWMFFETDIACPDPACGASFRVERLGLREYEYLKEKS